MNFSVSSPPSCIYIKGFVAQLASRAAACRVQCHTHIGRQASWASCYKHAMDFQNHAAKYALSMRLGERRRCRYGGRRRQQQQ